MNLVTTEIDETAIQKREALCRNLYDRFVYVGMRGGQAIYMDLETKTRDLTSRHLISYLTIEGASWLDANDIMRHFAPIQLRPIAQKTVYRPHEANVVTDKGIHFLNSWEEPLIQPMPEISAKPFRDHLALALGDAEKADYLIDALAFQYQRHLPSAKPHIAFYFFGDAQGQGKSLLASTLRAVFGDQAVRIAPSADKLKSMSAVDMWQRTWLVTEETDVRKVSELYDIIKSYTGMDQTESDRKYAHFDTYEIPAQLIMLSNREPSFIEPNDRRFFVSRWDTMLRGDEKKAYFDDYILWLESGGYGAIASLLQGREIRADLFREAPTTLEKLQAQNLAADEVVEALRQAIEDKGSANLFGEEAFDDIWYGFEVKRSQRKHKLSGAGLRKLGRKVMIKGQRRADLWIREGSDLISKKGVTPLVEHADGRREEALLASQSGPPPL